MDIIKDNLNETLTADGNTTDSLAADGAVTLVLTGNFGGGTAEMQVSYNGGSDFLTCVDLTGNSISFNAPSYIQHDSDTMALYRVNLSGSTSPSLNVSILIG